MEKLEQIPEIKNKEVIYPDIPEKFTESFPEGYRPWLDGWSFGNTEKLKETLPSGKYKLLTLDVNITPELQARATNARIAQEGIEAVNSQRKKNKGRCIHGCPRCFANADIENPIMTFDDVKKMILEGKELGLETVKFLGPTELLFDKDLFKILDFFKDEELKFSVFTKGAILGDDTIAQRYFGMSSEELCKKLYEYDNLRLLVSFESADPSTQQNKVGPGVQDYALKRNKAIENLARAGFNSDPKVQRLAMICAPVLKDNIDEAFEIYKWGAKRNIPVIVAPTMLSGAGNTSPEITDKEFKEETLVDVYVKIYTWLIQSGILTLDQVKKEGISPYAGYGCDQFATGMYIREDGVVRACPGNDSAAFRYQNDVRKSPLGDIWFNSLGYKIRKELIETGKLTTTTPCYAKSEGEIINDFGEPLVLEGSIPKDFYKEVLARVEEMVS